MVCRYLLNPYSIVTCAGFSTITLTNLSVTAALSTKLRGGSVLSSPQNRTPLNTRKPKMVCLVIVLSPQTERKFFCTILILLHKLVCVLYAHYVNRMNVLPPPTHAQVTRCCPPCACVWLPTSHSILQSSSSHS